jgi:hypothetical protein
MYNQSVIILFLFKVPDQVKIDKGKKSDHIQVSDFLLFLSYKYYILSVKILNINRILF